MRTFEYSDGKSNKFWSIELRGKSFTVTFGRVGTKGQTQTKEFPTEDRARQAHDKLIAEKLGKGYAEKAGPAPADPGAAAMREALEEALVANPDDLASHMAYADWLSEQSAPALHARGELIQVQLSLEDPSTPADARKRLRQREKKLLGAHAPTWLGELAKYLLPDEDEEEDDDDFADERCKFRLARGWLDSLSVARLSFGLARLLARSKESRLLRELAIESTADEVPDDPGDVVIPPRTSQVGLCPLVQAPSLANVRVFRLGEDQGEDYRNFNCYMHTRMVVDVVRQFPRLEELYLWANEYDLDALFSLPTLGHLRVLKVYHAEQPHRLDLLAANPALKRLTHLLFHPHFYKDGALGEAVLPEQQEEVAYLNLEGVRALLRSRNLPALTHLQLRVCSLGDAGCEEIVRSGVLKRLRSLDLRHGRVTDAGARVLAECPDLRRLEYLDLERNALTREGVARLRACESNLGMRIIGE